MLIRPIILIQSNTQLIRVKTLTPLSLTLGDISRLFTSHSRILTLSLCNLSPQKLSLQPLHSHSLSATSPLPLSPIMKNLRPIRRLPRRRPYRGPWGAKLTPEEDQSPDSSPTRNPRSTAPTLIQSSSRPDSGSPVPDLAKSGSPVSDLSRSESTLSDLPTSGSPVSDLSRSESTLSDLPRSGSPPALPDPACDDLRPWVKLGRRRLPSYYYRRLPNYFYPNVKNFPPYTPLPPLPGVVAGGGAEAGPDEEEELEEGAEPGVWLAIV